MSKSHADYYRAKESFVTMFEGEQVAVAAGEIVRAGHGILKRREDHFEPIESFGRFDPVEQATAAPREKRSTRKPAAKKPAAKPEPAKTEEAK